MERATAAAPPATSVGKRLLVVDDDRAFVGVVAMLLGGAGYEVLIAYDGEAALRLLREEHPDLVLLDLGLPGADGREICRRMRALESVPVIVVSGRGDEAGRAELLDLGADDYVAKPFGRKELLARIGAVLRRAPRAVRLRAGAVEVAGLRLDLATWRATVDGDAFPLTAIEFRLLERLARADEAVVAKADLLAAAWPDREMPDPEWVKAHVARLRAKLASVPRLSLESVRGVGYRLVVARADG